LRSDTHRRDPAQALHFLEYFQLKREDRSGVVETLGKIMEWPDVLVMSDPNAHRVALAFASIELAWFLRESNQSERGLNYVLDSVDIIRTAPYPDEFEVTDCLPYLPDQVLNVLRLILLIVPTYSALQKRIQISSNHLVRRKEWKGFLGKWRGYECGNPSICAFDFGIRKVLSMF